jgi:lysozyme family protein
MSFKKSFENLLRWEGGYGNNPHDAGGPTNLGVIQEEYDRYRHAKGLTALSVRSITRQEAEEIYRTRYWTPSLCDELDPGVANATFDADVNSGNQRGARWLQQAINVVAGEGRVQVDGVCGPQTVAAANALEPGALIDAMLEFRLAFMHIARNSKTGEALWPVFGRGWQSRINGVRVESHKLINAVRDNTQTASYPKTSIPERKMLVDTAVLSFAQIVAPQLARALDRANPLSHVALSLLASALDVAPAQLPEVKADDPHKLATALKLAEGNLQGAVTALTPPAAPPPAPRALAAPQPQPVKPLSGGSDTQNIYVDSVSNFVKYVIGIAGAALLIRLGMNVDTAQGIMDNVGPVLWSAVAGLVTIGGGFLSHRSITGSNAATKVLVSGGS